jgi:hypothetical protein
MKCFERLVMTYINTIIPDTLEPLQVAYFPNRSTGDTISIALHAALSHLDKRRNNCVRMLFIDYSLAFQHHSSLHAHQQAGYSGTEQLPL